MDKLRILHCPTTVGGNAYPLSRAQNDLGAISEVVTLDNNYLDYAVDVVVFKSRFNPLNGIKRWLWVVRSLCNYEVLHYNFGQTLAPTRLYPKSSFFKKFIGFVYNSSYANWLEMIDLVIAKKLGRVIAMTYQGDDARQGDYCAAHYLIHFCHEIDPNYYTPITDTVKRKRIKKIDRYADLIYAVNPDLLNVLPSRAKFIPYTSVDLNDWKPSAFSDLKIPHVVHAPSHRGVKGTEYIVKAFNRLQEEGIPFRYSLVEGISNKQARAIYETADLLVDQLLAGYYGGVSVELMALGKPVICYMREDDMRHLPNGMYADMPVINATPVTIYDVLKEYLTIRKGELRAIGALSRNYVEKWHNPQIVAASVMEDYRRIISARRRDS